MQCTLSFSITYHYKKSSIPTYPQANPRKGAKRRSSAAPGSLRKKYGGISIPQTWCTPLATLPHLESTGIRYYTVTSGEGESCGDICVSIEGKNGAEIGVSYDRSSDNYRISSDARSSRDTLGNTIGTSLRKAVGANTTKCDRGMEITCESALIKGLSYIVTNGCDWKGKVIPACAKVEGFEIFR